MIPVEGPLGRDDSDSSTALGMTPLGRDPSSPALLRAGSGDSSTPAALRAASARNDNAALTKLDRRSGTRRNLSDEQRAAIIARAPIVTVSAGAGSGKTTVLVERFIDLVQRDEVSPLEILAITFTEKAAAAMKERIVRELEKRGDVANRRLAEAAYISTIHGFCSRILREHPLAARLDPSFRVMDEVTRNVFIDEYLEQLYKDDWYVETEPLITKRFESNRPRLL